MAFRYPDGSARQTKGKPLCEHLAADRACRALVWDKRQEDAMASTDKTDAEKKESAEEIKRAEATERGPRGNAGGTEDDERKVECPPPLPH
jgi:hypothetical protein